MLSGKEPLALSAAEGKHGVPATAFSNIEAAEGLTLVVDVGDVEGFKEHI